LKSSPILGYDYATHIFEKSNIDKIAFLNRRFSKADDLRNLLTLADGYLLCAIELAKTCLADNEDKKADILIFPILTNANHGIELYLKCLNWTLNELIDIDKKIEGRHNIKQIYQTVRAKFKSYKGNMTYRGFKEATVELASYINELFDKIGATPQNDKMDFSRYPFGNDYPQLDFAETQSRTDSGVLIRDLIGISPTPMHSYTAWEIHPVTKIEFAPKPH
jgi:hypothetical protein